MAVPRLMFGADQLEPRLNIVILRDSHSSGYSLRSAGPLRHLGMKVTGIPVWQWRKSIKLLQERIVGV